MKNFLEKGFIKKEKSKPNSNNIAKIFFLGNLHFFFSEKKKGRKGQQQVLSAILLTGILIGIVGSIYLWGIPLIQKNKDIALLQSSEQFMKILDEKVKNIANSGGRDQLRITLPATVRIDSGASPNQWVMSMYISTQGTIYAIGTEIPLKNSTCTATQGSWGSDEPGILCVKSVKLDENKYTTTYTLSYVRLDVPNTIRSYSLELSSTGSKSIGMGHSIVIENLGTSEVQEGGRTVTKTRIRIDFV